MTDMTEASDYSYNLAACRILDARHEAVDECPDSPEGTCAICGYADGFRQDGWGHYTLASVEYVNTYEHFGDATP